MTMTEWLRAQVSAQAGRTRRALERIPEGREEWTPHERSMPFGRLAAVAPYFFAFSFPSAASVPNLLGSSSSAFS